MIADNPKTHYRSIFISDLHLGSRGAQADTCLTFMKETSCDYLYLIGDIVDLWALKRRIYFPQSHVNLIRKFLKRANNGTKVFYVVGNHDENLREFIPLSLGEVEIVDEIIHVTADGKRFFVVHGDRYDQIVKYARWVAWLGDLGYTMLLRSNRWVNTARRWFGYPEWSLADYVKKRVKQAVAFIGDFEQAAIHDAKECGADGVICGHIHFAADKVIGGIRYVNDGDWVESCTAAVEHVDGRIEVIRFSREQVRHPVGAEFG